MHRRGRRERARSGPGGGGTGRRLPRRLALSLTFYLPPSTLRLEGEGGGTLRGTVLGVRSDRSDRALAGAFQRSSQPWVIQEVRLRSVLYSDSIDRQIRRRPSRSGARVAARRRWSGITSGKQPASRQRSRGDRWQRSRQPGGRITMNRWSALCCRPCCSKLLNRLLQLRRLRLCTRGVRRRSGRSTSDRQPASRQRSRRQSWLR